MSVLTHQPAPATTAADVAGLVDAYRSEAALIRGDLTGRALAAAFHRLTTITVKLQSTGRGHLAHLLGHERRTADQAELDLLNPDLSLAVVAKRLGDAAQAVDDETTETALRQQRA